MTQPNRGLTPLFGVPRIRCDHDKAPLWCLMLGGIPTTEWMMTLRAAAEQLGVRGDR